MSASSSPHHAGSQAPYRRLKLVMSTTDHQPQSNSISQPNVHGTKDELSRSSSPARPSYSPVTPTLSQSSATGQDTGEPEWIDEPDPLPVSLDENPDVIALQATISLLQMQRQQSLRDIRGLSKIRQAALENPEAFVDDLRQGKLSKPASAGIALDPSSDEDDEKDKAMSQDQSRFGKLPTGQDIARCPPIEWSKYRIAGESLDRLHHIQREYPGITEEALAGGLQPRPHQIAAPYRPFTDSLDPLPPSAETRNYDA